ncbi:MAG: hypothetical protein H6823_24325 [Planctomycetaceae bacterium]|nr:hypothetical protein [Planctomycetaceae bacterium]
MIGIAFPADGQADITLTSGLGNHVLLQSINSVENYEIRSLEGDDDVNVAAPVRNALSVFAGAPGAGSDTLNLTAEAAAVNAVRIAQTAAASDDQSITGLGAAAITSNGVELITLTGQGAAMTRWMLPWVPATTPLASLAATVQTLSPAAACPRLSSPA